MELMTFQSELFRFSELLKNKIIFTLTRFGDGEQRVIQNIFANPCGGEWIFDPLNSNHQTFRKKIIETFKYRGGNNYYVGILPPSTIGWKIHNELKEIANQKEEQLTFCTLFMRSNYELFLKHIYPQFKNYDVIGVFPNRARFDNLDFQFKKIFTVGINAWIDNYNMIDEVPKYIKENNIKNHLFLFAAGPLAPMLIKSCYEIQPDNTYINIGSAMDILIGLGGTRHYLRGEANEKTNVDDWYCDKILNL